MVGTALGVAARRVDEDAAKRCIDLALDRFGSIDILVNNAGTNPVLRPRQQTRTTAASPRPSTSNLWAPILVDASLATPGMDGRTTVVRWSTPPLSAAWDSRPTSGLYNASKAALIHLTKQLALELSPNVRVNAMAPGVVRTKLAEHCGKSMRSQLNSATPARADR